VGGSLVYGGSADGVTQVLIRIPANNVGDSMQLTLVNEDGQQDTEGDGGLFPVGGNPINASSTLTVQAQNTSPPTAFALYIAPTNYVRSTQPQDATTPYRYLTLNSVCSDANGSSTSATTSMKLTRPPVVLVHGLWSNPSETWSNFAPLNPTNLTLWPLLSVQQVNYSYTVNVNSTSPSYIFSPTSVGANTLGFSYNAPGVLAQTLKAISNLETTAGVAAVQADVVAHSMGGNIVRAMPALPYFKNQSNYGFGPVHKLITIGTPHLGTPLAGDLLPSGAQDPNHCVRGMLGDGGGKYSFQTVTTSAGPVNGAVGDIAAAPGNLPPQEPFTMAYLAGSTNQNNLSGLGGTGQGNAIYYVCGVIEMEPLALELLPFYWTQDVFLSSANDGVVPVTSQLNTGQANGTSSTAANTFAGVIHSDGLKPLGFSPPSELDAVTNGIPDAVVYLLNEATSGGDFH
jgi:pimeloyl-ACP methyl ester carboxylesterase